LFLDEYESDLLVVANYIETIYREQQQNRNNNEVKHGFKRL
jgi:hypothetical protein